MPPGPALSPVSGSCGDRDECHPCGGEAVTAWPQLNEVTELRAFLGLIGYFRLLIQNFARVPLHAFLVGCTQKQTRRTTLTDWTTECETAFQGLKEALIKAPVLAFADFLQTFILYTDAS